MTRRPLLVGAVVAIVGAALLFLLMQRGADPVSTAPTSPATSSATDRASASVTGTASPSSTPSPTATTQATATASPTAGSSGTQAPRATAEPPQAASRPASSGIELVIPGIGLREGLHAEGLRGGKINPPSGTVMWYTGNSRVRPGDVGTAVIAGHVVSRGSGDAFVDLAKVGVGDRIQLAGANGPESYRVVRAGVVDKNALTTDQSVWGANSSVRRLAIITCDDAHGFRSDGHRVANYVVIAEPA